MTTLSPHICPACQTSNPPQAAFCFGCGQPLGPVAANPEVLHQRYRLLHQLGTGGFGSVHQAEDLQLGKRLVAVKEMSTRTNLSAQENAEAEAAFKREALLLADLMHPNLPRIYDHFSEGGRWYLVMDYIEGVTLEEYLAHTPDGSLPLSEALDMGLQLCDVLDYLHTRQPAIIFRDLKPLNIMRNAAGHLYLIDFGIARHFKPGQMKDTVAFGSPGYAAPEQYGKTQTTPRSDVYSLGAVLHQMLSGVDPSLNPFRFAPLRLPASQPTPRALAQLLARMLEMDETRRPATMSAVKGELQTIATSVASGTFARIQAPPAPPVTAATPATSPAVPSQSLARGDLRSRHDTRGVSLRALAWSPDNTRLASANDTNTVEIWNASTGKSERFYTHHTGSLRALSWSPDGQWLASAGEDRTVHVWNAANGAPAFIYREHTHTITSLAWSLDSQFIVSCSLDQSVQVWRRDNGYRYVNYRRHKDVVYRVAWSPNDKWITSTGYDGNIHMWEAMSGVPAEVYYGHVGQVLALAWSPDGALLASAGTDAALQILEALSGRLLHTYRHAPAQIHSLSWSPDGKQLVSGGAEEQPIIWDLTSDQQAFAYTGHTTFPGPTQPSAIKRLAFLTSAPGITTVAWSPDGNWIASGDTNGTVQVWFAK
ncbi:MAG TPA: WD40 repeat domain-containing serine/threonine-protein kinase [Ktedonobacteraceae bacterium]|jgi:serine/threonine protein kinase